MESPINMLYLLIARVCFIVFFQDMGRAVELDSKNGLQMLNVTIRRNSRFESVESFVLNSFIDMSIDQCISECGSRPGCKAVEYRYMAKHCSLRRNISTTVMAPGFLTVSGFDGMTTCRHATCSSKETCDTNTGMCLVKECGNPDMNRNFSGNRFEVGSRIVYDCSDHYEGLICTEDGQWEGIRQQLITYQGLTCRDIRQSNSKVRSGFYRNMLNMKIYCDFDDDDGGDWLVFQKRKDGSVDFYRNWEEYKMGFGYVCDEFWLGLEYLHTILRSSASQFELRIDLEDWEGNTRFALYDTFDLGDESDGYILHVGAYSGTAGDALNHVSQRHSGMMFSTYDRDNDSASHNCAVRYHGAWWYRRCHWSNLNGRYYVGGNTTDFAIGVVWQPWTTHFYSLKSTTMKIREK